jgi:hypothetical protein
MVFGNGKFFETEDLLMRMNDFENEMSDSIHFLSVDTLEYSLKTSEIRAAGFRLSPQFKNKNKNLYDVFVPRLHMKSRSISQLALNDSLKVQFLEFENPQINFYQKENPKKLQIEDINNFNLYTLIEHQFLKIEVDTFNLTGANIKIFKQKNPARYQQHFSNVDVSLIGFALDSTSSQNRNKLLHADELQMNVSDYYLRLEDNQHNFRANSMYFSTAENSLKIDDISILPADTSEVSSRTELRINCGQLKIDSVNLKNLYHTRTLPTKKIEITNPNVRVYYNTEIARKKKNKESGILFELVSAYLRGVYSDEVKINTGFLEIKNLWKKNTRGYFNTNFQFNLIDFKLDSTSIKQTDKFFNAEGFNIHFSDYQMKLVDDLHQIGAKNISILSSNSTLQIDKLVLKPIVNITKVTDSTMVKYNRSELYRVEVPQIKLKGIDLPKAFFDKQLEIKNFEISSPKIYFENYGALRETKEKKEFSEIYQLAFSYISDFDIEKIEIPDGNFQWINHTKKGKTTTFDNEFSATLEGFKLNQQELNKKRLLFSDNFEISVIDQMFQLSDSVHILKAGQITLSTQKKNIQIKNALLYPVITSEKYKQLATTFQVSIPWLQISNFNFLDAYYSKQLKLSQLTIERPKFEIYSRSEISKTLDLNKYKFPLPAFIKSLNLDELKINDAEVVSYETIGIDNFARSNFKLNLLLPDVSVKNNETGELQLASSNFIAKILDFRTPLGQFHELEIGEFNFNRSKKTLNFSKLRLNPFGKKGVENRFSIAAPKLSFTQFNINEALNTNSFTFDQIHITKPKIHIEINDSVKGDKFEFAQNLDLYPIVEPYVNNIKVNRLWLEDVDLNFNWFAKQMFDKNFNLNFNQINIGENQSPGNLLNSKEFEFSTTNLRTKTKNNLYEFSVDSLIYNSSKHNILLKKIKVDPLLKKEEYPRQTGFQTDFVKAETDFIEIKGLDEKLWLKEKIIDAEVLKVGKSDLAIFRNKRYPFNHSQRPPWPQDLIKEIQQPFIFDSVVLVPSTIEYSELMDISDKPGVLKFSHLSLTTNSLSNINLNPNFTINASAEIFNHTPLTAKFNFDLTDPNYTHTLKGSLGKMDMIQMNPMVEKSAPISIESGQLNRFDFDLKLNGQSAKGELFLGYDNFSISILDLGYKGTKKSKLASFWANKLVLNSKNPKGDKFLPVSISYDKDIERSIINYWWKSIFTGSKETLGIKNADSK